MFKDVNKTDVFFTFLGLQGCLKDQYGSVCNITYRNVYINYCHSSVFK